MVNRFKSLSRTFSILVTLLTLSWASAQAGTSSFRFVFLSDTHVGSTTGEEDLREAVRDINALTNVEFVLLSGDVTEYGSRAHLQLAKELLSQIKIPVHVVPGNHDTKWSESGATDFPRIYGDERFNIEFGGYRFIAIHEGPLMKMGDGFWSPQDVRWLSETLKNLPDKNQPIIFVTHYPIDDGIANWFEVLDILKRYNTQFILCGHGHANHSYSFEGVPGVMGRSNLRNQRPTGGFNIVEIKNGNISFTEHINGGETNRLWHTNVLEKHDYASDTNQYPRPDFSVNKKYPKVKSRWEFNTGYTISSTPAVWQDRAIVGDASGTVYAFDLKTGAIKWKFSAANAVYSTPDVSGNTVVFAGTDGNIYALDAGNGQELWRFKTARAIVACPRIVDGVVYIGSSEDKFRALNLADGKQLWEFDGVNGFVETRPLVQDGRVIFGAWDTYLYALDQKTGSLIWKWKGDRPGTLLSPAACWPVAVKGKIFIAAPDRKLTAIDEKTGNEVWRTGEFEARESIGLSADGKRLYVRAMNKFIYAVSTSGGAPSKVWKLDGGFGYDINSAMLVEKDGVVFYGTKNDLLMAIDAKSGALKWQHKMGTGVMNTVVPLSAKEVLITDFSGKVALVVAE